MVSRDNLSKEEREQPLLPLSIGSDNPPPGSDRWTELKKIALFHFDESERRFSQAIEAFKEHLEKFPADANTHEKHIYICTYQRAISQGRKELFQAICSILENEGTFSKQTVQYLLRAYNNFNSAI